MQADLPPVKGPLAPAQFVAKLSACGLSLTLSESGDALVLTGPQEARTDKIRHYLRTHKNALLQCLREQESEPDRCSLPSGEPLTDPTGRELPPILFDHGNDLPLERWIPGQSLPHSFKET